MSITDKLSNLNSDIPITSMLSINCSYNQFGNCQIYQDNCYSCKDCDPQEKNFLCFECYNKCHANCTKDESAYAQSQYLICACATTFCHKPKPKEIIKQTRKCNHSHINKDLGYTTYYQCDSHNGEI